MKTKKKHTTSGTPVEAIPGPPCDMYLPDAPTANVAWAQPLYLHFTESCLGGL
jgi:hypothetical protein